jgi:hypothetical protein
VIQPQYVDDRPRIRNPRRARGATDARRKHNSRARYAAITRFCMVLGIASVLLVGWVTMTSNLTGMTYAVAKADVQRARLQGETARLDDKLSGLRSQERLATFAARLGMKEPQQFALVRIAPPTTGDAHVALIPAFAALFGGTPARPSVR